MELEVNLCIRQYCHIENIASKEHVIIFNDIIYVDCMTLPDQSQTEVWRLTTSLTKPKVNVNIGCWNVRTLYSIGKSAQLAREMNKYKIDVMGISKCRWMGQRKVKLNIAESVIFFR